MANTLYTFFLVLAFLVHTTHSTACPSGSTCTSLIDQMKQIDAYVDTRNDNNPVMIFIDDATSARGIFEHFDNTGDIPMCIGEREWLDGSRTGTSLSCYDLFDEANHYTKSTLKWIKSHDAGTSEKGLAVMTAGKLFDSTQLQNVRMSSPPSASTVFNQKQYILSIGPEIDIDVYVYQGKVYTEIKLQNEGNLGSQKTCQAVVDADLQAGSEFWASVKLIFSSRTIVIHVSKDGATPPLVGTADCTHIDESKWPHNAAAGHPDMWTTSNWIGGSSCQVDEASINKRVAGTTVFGGDYVCKLHIVNEICSADELINGEQCTEQFEGQPWWVVDGLQLLTYYVPLQVPTTNTWFYGDLGGLVMWNLGTHDLSMTQAENIAQSINVNEADGANTACAQGTYREESSSNTCLSCPAGKTTASTGSTSAADCFTSCEPGYGGDPCALCSAGTYSLNNLCEPCTADGSKTSPAGSNSSAACLCSAGFERDGEACTACATGSEKLLAGDHACECSAGFELDSNDACTACATGSEKLLAGDHACECSANFERDSNDACTACATGSEKPLAGDHACVCSANFERDSNNACTACATGSEKPLAGDHDCVCSANFQRDSNDACIACPANSEKPLAGNGTCVCSANFERDSENACVSCASSMYKLTAGDHACECSGCASNHYLSAPCRDGGVTECRPCTNNSVTVSAFPVLAHFDGGSAATETFDGSRVHTAGTVNLHNASWTFLIKIKRDGTENGARALSIGRHAAGENGMEVQFVNGYWQLLVSVNGNYKSDFEASDGTCTPCEHGLEHLYPQNKNATAGYDEIVLQVPRTDVIRFTVNGVQTTYGAGVFPWLDVASLVSLAGQTDGGGGVQADTELAGKIAGFYAYSQDLAPADITAELAKIIPGQHDAVYDTVAGDGENASSVCVCAEDYYGDAVRGCSACPPGTQSPINTTSEPACIGPRCDQNEYYDEGSTECKPCPANSTSEYGQNDCACSASDFPDVIGVRKVAGNPYGEKWARFNSMGGLEDAKLPYIQDFSAAISHDSAHIWTNDAAGFKQYDALTLEENAGARFGTGLGFPLHYLRMSQDGLFFFGCAPVGDSLLQSKVYKWGLNQATPQELTINGFCGDKRTHHEVFGLGAESVDGNVLMAHDGSFVLVYSREHHETSFRTWLYKISVDTFSVLHTIDLGLGSAAGHRSFNSLRTIALSQDNQRLYYQDQTAGAGNGNCRIYVEDLSADIDPAQDTQLAVNDGQCDATNNWRTDPLLWSWVPASFLLAPDGITLYHVRTTANQYQVYSFNTSSGVYAHETPVVNYVAWDPAPTAADDNRNMIVDWQLSPNGKFILAIGKHSFWTTGMLSIMSHGGELTVQDEASCSACPLHSSVRLGSAFRSVFEPGNVHLCECNAGYAGNVTSGCFRCEEGKFMT